MSRLLQINVTANWGSTGRIAETIGLEAIERGWESYIAYGRCYNPSQSKLIRIGRGWDKYLHYAEQRIRDNEGLCSRESTRKLIRQIDYIKPDVVQLHNIHDHYLNYQILFNYLNHSEIKVVWSFHDCWAFTGHCFHFVTHNCQKWRTGCSVCPMKNDYPKTMMDRSEDNYELKKSLFCDCSNLTIVAVSDWMADLVRHSFLGEKRIEIIKNGVDLDVFSPVETKHNKGYNDILAVSNVWNHDKGLDDIIGLRNILPLDYRITVIGLNERQMSELPEGIVGHKRTQNIQELVKFYTDADVLINPTYADTFPTVNLEALSCGTPVITYNTGGSPEAVDEKTGLVVDQGDVRAMAEAIVSVCSKGREYYSSACRRSVEEQFDRNKCYQQYLDLYEDLLAK